MVTNVTGSSKVTVPMRHSSEMVEIDFTPPFKRISIMEELEKHVGTLPSLDDSDVAEKLRDLCTKHHVRCGPPYTTARLLDKLIGHFIEPQCIQPTYLTDHPLIMSPLAREHNEKPGLCERFELFVNGAEIANAYSELNDPREQRKRFSQQMKEKELGDTEIRPIDEDFCTALEYGLPPTGGWGMGIDRVIMLLTSASTIKEVITFPVMKLHKEGTLDEIIKS